jgi:hypothetical protein
MKNLIWRLLAKLLARPAVSTWLIARAQRTPYQHIMSADGQDTYMGRWWLFNPYNRETHIGKYAWFPWSIRIHHILRPDADRDLHDHPWHARTVILRGSYTEQRLLEAGDPALTQLLLDAAAKIGTYGDAWQATEYIDRNAGDTAELRHLEYHRIDSVSDGGVWTMFITSRWQGDWGFLVNGKKVD